MQNYLVQDDGALIHRKRPLDVRLIDLSVFDPYTERALPELADGLRKLQFPDAIRLRSKLVGQIRSRFDAVDGKTSRHLKAVGIDARVQVVHADQNAGEPFVAAGLRDGNWVWVFQGSRKTTLFADSTRARRTHAFSRNRAWPKDAGQNACRRARSNGP